MNALNEICFTVLRWTARKPNRPPISRASRGRIKRASAQLAVLVCVWLTAPIVAPAATVWNGPKITFSKAGGANWTLEANQDRITPNVWLTRANLRGIFNIRTESGFVHGVSPADTEWATGTTANYASLTYTDWETWTGSNPPGTVGVNAVVHLISDDIYIDIRFTSWGVGAGGGGSFSYERSTASAANMPPSVAITSPSDGALFTTSDDIMITAVASDSDGTVSQVEIFDGATSLGVDNASSLSLTVNLAPGSHTLTAVATDNEGASTTSDAVTISVDTVPIDNPIAERVPKGDRTIELQLVADGLISPLGMAVPDDGSGRVFVYDQAGIIWLMTAAGIQPEPVLNVRSRLVPLGNYDERGLLGAATHPEFAANPFIYTYTSETNDGPADFTSTAAEHFHQSVLTEWRMDAANPNRVDLASRRELLRIDQPQNNHNGGTMRFGPDGFLYISLGDGGFRDDQGDGHLSEGNAQHPENIYGTVVRIDVDGANSGNGRYGIPADNPFVGDGGLEEVFAYGLRNPFSFSFDRGTGQLYLGDVGQNKVEEVDLIVSGGNYGWRVKEGTFYFDPNGDDQGYVTATPVGPVPPDLIDPIAQYDHDDGLAVVGGYVYRGSGIPSLAGVYVFGDWGSFGAPSGRLYYLDEANVVTEFRLGLEDRALGYWIKGFGEDAGGELYVMVSQTLGPNFNTGRIYKIVPAPAPLSMGQVATLAPTEVMADWGGGRGPYALQSKSRLDDPTWMNRDFTVTTSTTTPQYADAGFFRVKDTAYQPAIALTAYLTTNAAGVASSSPTAMGAGTLSLEGNLLRFDIEYHDLSGPATLAHIHGPAPTDGTAGVQVNLAPYNGDGFGVSGSFSGTVLLSDAQKAMVLEGQTYVNIHTGEHGGGEIRGQIAPVLMTAALNGRNVTSPVDTAATGLGVFALVGNRLTMNITYRGLSGPATSAHIHGPASLTENAGVLINLAPFNGSGFDVSGMFVGTAILTPGQLANVIDGQTYVNIHTAAHGGGEIRGQILPQATAVPLSAHLSPEAAGVSAPGAGGEGLFSLEGDTLIFSINYGGLSGPATLAHIHGPAPTTNTAGVLINLAPFNGGSFGTEGTLAGTVVLTSGQKDYLLSSQTYVNIHTGANGGGEIRGQIAPVLMNARLNGFNEQPSKITTATGSGSGLFLLVEDQLSFNLTYRGLTGDAVGVHIHGSAPINGTASVLVNLLPFSIGPLGSSGSLAGTALLAPGHIGSVIDTMTYVNFHTDANTGGEIRGQILR